jgi:hypothetical protein
MPKTRRTKRSKPYNKQTKRQYKNQRGGNNLVELVDQLKNLIDNDNPYITIARVSIPCIVHGDITVSGYNQKEHIDEYSYGPPQEGSFDIYSPDDFNKNLDNIKKYNDNLETAGNPIIDKIYQGIEDKENLGNIGEQIQNLITYIEIFNYGENVWKKYPPLVISSYLSKKDSRKNSQKEISIFNIHKDSTNSNGKTLYKYIESKSKKQTYNLLNKLLSLQKDYHPNYLRLCDKLKAISSKIYEIKKKNKTLTDKLDYVSSDLTKDILNRPIEIEVNNKFLNSMFGCYDNDFSNKKDLIDTLFEIFKMPENSSTNYVKKKLILLHLLTFKTPIFKCEFKNNFIL